MPDGQRVSGHCSTDDHDLCAWGGCACPCHRPKPTTPNGRSERDKWERRMDRMNAVSYTLMGFTVLIIYGLFVAVILGA